MFARVVAECLRRERFAMREGPGRTNGMNPAHEAADPLERLEIAELGRTPAAPRVDRIEEARGLSLVRGRDHRHLALGELLREGVLFLDLRFAPASGPVELRHHRRAVLEPDLVDAILIGGKREQPPVGAQAQIAQRIERHLGREGGIGMHWRIVVPWPGMPWKSGTCISRSVTWKCCAGSRSTSRAAAWSRSSAAAARANRRFSSLSARSS